MEGTAAVYKCKCGYEFLSKTLNPTCPKCKSTVSQTLDMDTLIQFDD